MQHDLTIVPVINKIDLTHARVDEVKEEMEHTLAIDAGRSARLQRQDRAQLRGRAGGRDRARAAADRRSGRHAAGDGVRLGLRRVPRRGHLRARHERHGPQRAADQVPAGRHDARRHRARPVHAAARRPRAAHRRPGRLPHLQHQVAGQRPHRRHGHRRRRRAGRRALPGYQEPKRMVFCGLYPSDGQDFEQLRDALDKLSINDPSFEFEPEIERRAGLRLPLRLPGPVAHGDRAAAARAGLRHRPGADGAERHVRNHDRSAARSSKFTRRRKCPTRARSRSSASRSCG